MRFKRTFKCTFLVVLPPQDEPPKITQQGQNITQQPSRQVHISSPRGVHFARFCTPPKNYPTRAENQPTRQKTQPKNTQHGGQNYPTCPSLGVHSGRFGCTFLSFLQKEGNSTTRPKKLPNKGAPRGVILAILGLYWVPISLVRVPRGWVARVSIFDWMEVSGLGSVLMSDIHHRKA